MTRPEVSKLLARIQTHYSSLKVDDFMIDEWLKELKNYKDFEVNEKLEQHLRNEEYGKEIPKLYYLIRYLNKENNNKKPLDGQVVCRLCNQCVKLKDYDKHFERCLDVDYLNRVVIKAGSPGIDKDKYRRATDESFERVFYQTLEKCIKGLTDEDEVERIEKILSSRSEKEVDIQNESFEIGEKM